MTCPDCTRARLFSRVNKGAWWRRWFGSCWYHYTRRRDWLHRWRFALVLAALAANVLAWLWAGRRWAP
jgi:hypothetical protein